MSHFWTTLNLNHNNLYKLTEDWSIFSLFVHFAAKLELVSTRFEGAVVLRIRSVKENSYLCVDLEGNLTTEVRAQHSKLSGD